MVRQGGFAILEVSIAAFLLGITIVGISLMFSVGQGFIAAEGDNRVSLFLAQQRLEQIRAATFATDCDGALPDDPFCPTDPTNNTLTAGQIDENPVSTNSLYRRRTSIVCVRDDEPLGTNYSTLCDASAGGTCPTVAPFCPSTHNTRVVIVTVENAVGGTTDRETRPITLRSVIARR